MNWLGLDIGGVNLKAADGRGWAASVPFSLSREPHGLASALLEMIASAPNANSLAITMTGELCDCFRTKAEGVHQILAAAERAADGRQIRVYLVDGRFVSPEAARESPRLAAAGNWHALATFAARFLPAGQSGLLIDIGSTTTDIIPLAEGRPVAIGRSDTERLVAGELVYTGVGRTPVCAVVNALRWRSKICPLAAELFATTADAYVVLGEMDEQPDAIWTADGRPLTREFSRERLARMICADRSMFDEQDAREAAVQIREAQLRNLQAALKKVCEHQAKPLERVVVSGSGEFLARALLREMSPNIRVTSLERELGSEVSACCPAHAVAVLACE